MQTYDDSHKQLDGKNLLKTFELKGDDDDFLGNSMSFEQVSFDHVEDVQTLSQEDEDIY